MIAICGAVALPPLTPAAAGPAVGEGVGTYACSEFLKASAADPSREALYFSWAQGWMTGWNLTRLQAKKPGMDLAGQTIDQQQALLQAYCIAHPTALYMEAVYRLYFSLKPLGKP
jgi:hypothetical protein